MTRKIKVDAPDFDGRHDPNAFVDWLDRLEDYFEFYGMTDIHMVRFAKMKLVGSAKKYWQSVQRDIDHLGGPPIVLWAEMKQKLKDKYLPYFHKRQMMDDWLNLKQLNSSVSDYYARFEEMKLRCAVSEEQWVTVTRFINGLREDLKGDVSLHQPESLMEAYQKALEIDKYKKPSYTRRWTSQAGESKPSKTVTFQKGQSQSNQFSKSTAQPNQPASSAKSSSFTSPSLHPSSMVCHKCHERGHPASRCPNRALTIGSENMEEDEPVDETVYPVVGDTATESEGEEYERESPLNVMRCFLSAADCDSWKRTAIFETKMNCGDTILRLVIDNGSSMNVISKSVVRLLNLKPVPYSTPIRVAWVDKTSLTISEKSEVLQLGAYYEKIWCNVLNMDVAHVLLGRPWLYDKNATNFGKDNTYVFTHNGKRIKLAPARPSDHKGTSPKTSHSKTHTKKLHFLSGMSVKQKADNLTCC